MSIYRDKRTGRWQFEFDHRIDGQRPRKRRLLPAGWTRAQADAYDRKESAALYAIATGIAKPRHLIDEAVRRYLKERAPHLKTGASIELELEGMRDWWSGRPIDELPEVCAEYAEDQHGALAPATIKNRIAYVRAACRWAWKRHKLADADPGARVVSPSVSNQRKTYIARKRMLQLARACGCANENQRKTRKMIRVAFYTGWRFDEIVRATVANDYLVLDDSKNGDTMRVLPIHPRIQRYVGTAWPIHETMSYWFRKARTKIGMHGLHFHDLRHSAASEIVSDGGSLKEVAEVLGHKSLASSQRYAHLMPDAVRAAVGRIGRKRA